MKKRVLVLCTGNSCRSQMAEGFFKQYGKKKFDVVSAGINPATVNPLTIQVMKEIDINISEQRSKSATNFITEKFDYVITVCDNARQTCPVFASLHEKIHWDVEDPAAAQGSNDEKLRVFREARDTIKEHVLKFVTANPH